ncbi:cation:proton antiporter domain-containing protein [Streptomyces rhizosphaerihabitans]|uniref:cation:proton antiporter domain-containing protein n=1 Tax=Streptomyces rhizosphaerihabitans TaxID=1266770 RepID=UPI0021C0F655|nr:cation:proton antiporter [Streptomyces rhizosphaerihabitans]MCT9011565.1 cation:proton antiporter [Streptomyces rhizosphaerihabitans]
MTGEDILLGIALTVALATGSQILANKLRVPALIILLPVGFTAGALTDVIHPARLVGPDFPALVSLSVAVILYDAGLGLNLRNLTGRTRGTVVRLLIIGILVTFLAVGGIGPALFGIPLRVAAMIGMILVVSGPTVVGPLLEYVRPTDRLRRILIWEGTLTDPIGAILGAVVFHAVATSHRVDLGRGYQIGQFLISMGVGLVGGAVGTVILWLTLHKLRLGETLGTLAQLATVILVSAGCDIVRDDTGLIAAIFTGLAITNLPGMDMPARRPFLETLVQMIIGLLFISISSAVTPDSVVPVLVPSLILIAVLVLLVRPLIAYASARGSDLTVGEWGFIGWMAPRGIVAASTASAFSATLVAKGLPGAAKILPITFLVIVGTVLLYALTAAPVARKLGVVRSARTRPLLVGGAPWVIGLGKALEAAGLDVLMWAGLEEERQRITAAGIELAHGEMLATATNPRARLEGVTAVFLLTDDDFNALASVVIKDNVQGPVYRVGPPRDSHGVVAPYTGGDILFGHPLVRHRLAARYEHGARFHVQPGSQPVPADRDILFVVRADGRLVPVTGTQTITPLPDDTAVLMGSV